MRKLIQVIGATTLLAGLAAPVLAQTQMDVAVLTCGEWAAMDAAGKLEATNAVTNFVNDVKNAEVGALAATSIKGLPVEDVNKMIDNSCMDKDVAATVVSVMK